MCDSSLARQFIRISNSCFKENTFIYSNHDTSTVMQSGPTCGLAALCMAQQIYINNAWKLENVLEIAIKKDITFRGEMFSVTNLANLAKELVPNNVSINTSSIKSIQDCVTHFYKNKGIILIPYDADANHEPCCRNGHKAHWAVLTGLLLEIPSDSLQAFKTPLKSFMENFHYLEKLLQEDLMLLEQFIDPGKTFFIAKQSKSKHFGLWSYESMLASNCNLLDLNPSRVDDPYEYKIPSGGVEAGLCGQAVFLHAT